MIEAIVLSAVTSETKASGEVRKVTFLLPNDSGDHPFRGAIGQRLGLVCVKLEDDEHDAAIEIDPDNPLPLRSALVTTIDHETPAGVRASAGQGEDTGGGAVASRASPERTPWDKLTPTRQAGIRCKDQEFWDFLSGDDFLVANESEAAHYVREYCKVKSRIDLALDPDAARRWRHLDNLFLLRPRDSGTA